MSEEDKNKAKPPIHPTRKVFLDYWLSRTPEERLSAVEFARRWAYGDPGPMLKVARIIKLPKKGKQDDAGPPSGSVNRDP